MRLVISVRPFKVSAGFMDVLGGDGACQDLCVCVCGCVCSFLSL